MCLYQILVLRPYLLTPRCRVLPEQLTGLQLVKKFPAFHGNRRFITALKSVRHLSLTWASPIHSIYPHTTSCRSTLILSTHLRLGLPSGLFPSGFPTKTLYIITKITPQWHSCVRLPTLPKVPTHTHTHTHTTGMTQFLDVSSNYRCWTPKADEVGQMRPTCSPHRALVLGTGVTITRTMTR